MLAKGNSALNLPLTIRLTWFHFNYSSALNVQVTDASFSPAYFDLVNAILKFSIPRVAPYVSLHFFEF